MRSYALNRVPIKRRPRMTVRGGHPSTYTDAQTVADEAAVAAAYKGPHFHDAPVAVRIDIYRALPKSTPRRIESEPDTIKPDVDNVAKAVLDGLNGVAYDDDAQVVDLRIVKHDRIRKAGDSIRFTVEEARSYGSV